jgi:adenine-specific DNA-methyltransferase
LTGKKLRAPKLSIKNLPDHWLFPTTRYRGSKRKILPWIWEGIKDLEFKSVLDLFGGTSVVSILFKRMGKQVTYNDYLLFNQTAGIAFISNKYTRLTNDDLDFILASHKDINYEKLIHDTFAEYYFKNEENRLLDFVIQNIIELSRFYSGNKLREKQSLAFWAVGQACLMKRPFNLFHRKNLYLRTNSVQRQFGNKTTWEWPFPDLIERFVNEANNVVWDNGKENKVLGCNAFDVKQANYDLVYLDPPYFYKRQKDWDYRDIYHFLEGMVDYKNWRALIDWDTSNLRLNGDAMRWPAKSKDELVKLYKMLIDEFCDSILVISHKSGSLVSVKEIEKLLMNQGKKVEKQRKRYQYALSKQNGKRGKNTEWLIIGI